MKSRPFHIIWSIVIIALATAVVITPVWADDASDVEEESANKEEQGDEASDIIDHSPFEAILEDYVNDKGMIDYAGLRRCEEGRQTLIEYVGAIGTASPEGASEEAQKAFLINAYNALVIFDVLQRWPVENVLEEDGFFDERLHRVAGARVTLDRLEKKSLHARFGDRRTHFAVVCAARSCPRLRNTAFTAKNVDEMLESIAREYIPRVTSLGDDGEVITSQLFEWYEDSFRRDADSVAEFLARFVDDDQLRRALSQEEVTLEYSEYDWRINAQ